MRVGSNIVNLNQIGAKELFSMENTQRELCNAVSSSQALGWWCILVMRSEHMRELFRPLGRARDVEMGEGCAEGVQVAALGDLGD